MTQTALTTNGSRIQRVGRLLILYPNTFPKASCVRGRNRYGPKSMHYVSGGTTKAQMAASRPCKAENTAASVFSIRIKIENSSERCYQATAMSKPADIPGKLVPQGAYSAFVPAPLPPALAWTPRLVGVLSEADRLIGRLAGEGGRLPNPHVLMRPFVRREAVLSSRIEGTRATLGELLAAEAGAIVERSPEDLRRSATMWSRSSMASLASTSSPFPSA
jgi:hypothetical protein